MARPGGAGPSRLRDKPHAPMLQQEGDGLPPSAPAASSDQLQARLAALAGLDLEQLRREWERLHRCAPPLRLSRDLLQRSVAHRLQEEALGRLPPAAQRRLATLARALTVNREPAAVSRVKLKAGATLVREWHGRTHTVLVRDKGFEHEGKHYASLTQIAHAITGAHWSGPSFFGLRRAATTSNGAPDSG